MKATLYFLDKENLKAYMWIDSVGVQIMAL